MTGVRSTCQECRNPLELHPYEMFIVTFPNGRHQYHYECLLCGQLNIHWLGHGGLKDLRRLGVATIIITPPRERRPPPGRVIDREQCERWDEIIRDPDLFWDDFLEATS